jgi:transposase
VNADDRGRTGRADWLSPARLKAWLRRVGYTGGSAPEVLYARLAAAPRGVTGKYGATTAQITCALASALSALVEQIKVLTEQISEQLDTHADAHIFTSLPRSGRVRAARLLTEIGDCRARFPTPEALFCLAGAAPSTRQSGKVKVVSFRWAVDKQLRDAVCDFAGQPVGSQALHRRHCPGPRPPARGAHPGPRLALRHLALLAGRRRLRPSQT